MIAVWCGSGRVFIGFLKSSLCLIGFESCCAVGVDALFGEVVCTSASDAEGAPTNPGDKLVFSLQGVCI